MRLFPVLIAGALLTGCGGETETTTVVQTVVRESPAAEDPSTVPDDAGARYNADDAADEGNSNDARWLANFCELKFPATPTDVHAVMGEPTDVAVTGNRREDVYHSDDVTLSAVYMNGKAEGYSVIIGNVPCEDFRVAP